MKSPSLGIWIICKMPRDTVLERVQEHTALHYLIAHRVKLQLALIVDLEVAQAIILLIRHAR